MKPVRFATSLTLMLMAPYLVVTYLNEESLDRLQRAVITSEATQAPKLQLETPIAAFQGCVSGYVYAPRLLDINGALYVGVHRDNELYAHVYTGAQTLHMHKIEQDRFRAEYETGQNEADPEMAELISGLGDCTKENLYIASLDQE